MSDTRQWKDYVDQNGLPCQLGGDGGDSAQRLGMIGLAVNNTNAAIVPDLPNYVTEIDKLEIQPGIMIRNPIKYNNPDDFSRDQQSAIVIASGYNNDQARCKRLLWAHIQRFGKYQNSDWGAPDDFACYFRALNWYFMYPLVLLGDMFLLGSVLVRLYKAAQDPTDTSDDLDLTMQLIQAKENMATPISWAARLLYKKFRRNGVQWAFDSYFSEASGAPPMNVLYESVLTNRL